MHFLPGVSATETYELTPVRTCPGLQCQANVRLKGSLHHRPVNLTSLSFYSQSCQSCSFISVSPLLILSHFTYSPTNCISFGTMYIFMLEIRSSFLYSRTFRAGSVCHNGQQKYLQKSTLSFQLSDYPGGYLSPLHLFIMF